MTLRELSIRLTGASWRRRYEYRAGLKLAWYVALLGRIEKMPDLEELLGPKDATPEQTEEIKGKLQRAAWIDWAIANGIPIVKHDHPVM